MSTFDRTGDSAEEAGSLATPPVRSVAVIDIGTTSIRLAIGEIDADGRVKTLEELTQAVNLGKDAFTTGAIQKATIKECVHILKSYLRVLSEYGVTMQDQIRVVATSAIREATNRLAFLDRVYSATGLEIEPIDEAEVNRLTYLGIRPYLKDDPRLASGPTIIAEVGGGNTELLIVHNGSVTYSHTYKLGSLRLRETLETYRVLKVKVRNIMASQIEHTLLQVRQHIPAGADIKMIALGSEVRFAATLLLPEWSPDQLGCVRVSEIEKFTDKILNMTEEKIVRKYHLTFPDAEAVGPALLAYTHLARAFDLDHLLVSRYTLREGLLNDIAVHDERIEVFSDQIIRSALELGKRYGFDEVHARHVADLCKIIFKALREEHQLKPWHKLILYIAALLHEIGHYVNASSHHKHSMYLITNSELFGLSKQDVLFVGLVARYHRRNPPKSSHTGYASLDRKHRVAVAKMAAILRVADALDRSHSQRITDIECVRENGKLVISVPHVEDLSLEQLALQQRGSLFEEIFGVQVLLRTRHQADLST